MSEQGRSIRPKNIQLSRSNDLLAIQWADGGYSDYPISGLRSACPCAQCREGHQNMGLPGSPEMLEIPLVSMEATRLESVEVIGNYALQLVWGDGHKFGIYTWEYLRQLSPPKEGDPS